MRQGLTFGELAELHRGGVDPLLSTGDARQFLIVERVGDLADHATVELAQDCATSAMPLPSTQARVFAVVGKDSPWVSLGRSIDADLWIDDPGISKLHLRFRCEGHALFVGDQGSRNGTQLNGERLDPGAEVPLVPGDVLEIAKLYRATFVSAETLLGRLDGAATPASAVGAQPVRGGILAGKVAVITGGGRGLGRAYALRFAEEGCRVVVNDTGAPPYGPGSDASVAAATVAEIERAGGSAMASSHDISSRVEVEALFELARQRFGGVDILVCSAGALHAGSSLLEMDEQIWDGLMAVNARGTFLCVQAAARSMLEQRRPGRIITTSSMAMNGNAGLIGYAASKAAVYSLSQTAALELAAHDITVNTLTPVAWTRLTETIPMIAATPNAKQVLSTSYVADVALFLASDLSASITGHVIDVGGPQLSFHRMRHSVPVLPSSGRWTPHELRRRWQELTSLWRAD